jgi:hypothetical protein
MSASDIADSIIHAASLAISQYSSEAASKELPWDGKFLAYLHLTGVDGFNADSMPEVDTGDGYYHSFMTAALPCSGPWVLRESCIPHLDHAGGPVHNAVVMIFN